MYLEFDVISNSGAYPQMKMNYTLRHGTVQIVILHKVHAGLVLCIQHT